MTRGVEIALYQSMVLEKIPEQDKALASEIFKEKSEMGVTAAYAFVHGVGIGFFLWMISLHLVFGRRALEEVSLLTSIPWAIIAIAAPIWLLYKFHYGPKYARLKTEFQVRLQNDPEFNRVNDLMEEKGKEVREEHCL